jgi:CheY-like chemotaxis protein
MGRGTGLGLAFAHGIIKSHGGIINIDSEKGKGTTFDIHLPASKKEVTKKEKKPEDKILKGTETVLLVDDENMILNVGKDMLREMGYKVLLAGSGKEAVEVYSKVKALLASGYSIDGQAAEIMELGCDGFIQKPFNVKKLSGKIREILDKK